jgi:biotin carboxyl carrier protein
MVACAPDEGPPMKYRVTIEGREREVDVTFTPSGAAEVMLDGAKIEVDARRIGGAVSLRIGDRVHDVLSAGTDEVQIAAGAARAVAVITSERSGQKRGVAAAKSGKELRAPMPGRVVRVLVKAGDAVAAGQPLVVIEAMKMENELRAAAAVTIETVHVSEGASVEGRALLVSFAN